MNAAVVLEQPSNVSFTNLDQISGKAILRCGKSSAVDAIIVKLEGESRTRLLSPAGPNGEKPKPQLEYHKILYKTQMVFPQADVLEGRDLSASKSAYTLPPGTHEYPFSFKLPFNNSCSSEKGRMPTIAISGMSISGSGLEVANPPTRHVKRTLPPTLSGFPGEAEIRYFVKTTIQRHGFWKENPRAWTPFNFFPIEPPRPPVSGHEVYGRQKHAFSPFQEGESAKSKMKGIFSGKSKEPSSPTSPTASSDAPSISVDARLPESAILTCNDDIPLRILVKKVNGCRGMIYLQSLQVQLIGSTKIRAHDVFRTEVNSWIIMSKTNMGIPIGTASDPEDTEIPLDDQLWRGQPLPNSVAPSFETCNIERQYQLDIRIGLSYAGFMQSGSKVGRGQIPRIPQTIVLPLRLDCKIFSGIAPPPELLEAMAQAKEGIRRTSTTISSAAMPEKLKAEGRTTSTTSSRTSSTPSPSQKLPGYVRGEGAPALPERPGQQPPQYSDAPPSYEDAVASDLPPIDAPRPDYVPPPPADDDMFRSDEKRGSLHRRDS